MMLSRFLLGVMAITGLVAPASATEIGTVCYDLKVRAKAIRYLPTVIPSEESEDKIFITWPWFVDLKIKRVLEGEGSKGDISTLALLHGGMGTKTTTYFLRTNTAGSYNLIRTANEDELQRCPPDIAPAPPMMWDLSKKSLEEYRSEAEEKDRRYRDEYED